MTNRRTLRAVVVALGLVAASVAAFQLESRAQPPPKPGKPHLEIPDTEAATCLICHEGIDQAKVQHMPVAEGMCSTCHEFSGTGEETRVALFGVATSGEVAPLCLVCHDDVGASLKTDHTHVPAASGECTLCHSPHGSDHERLLTMAQAELCTMCHDDVGASLKAGHAHLPAAEGQCTLCHSPHGAEQPRLLTMVQVDLCTMCHDDVGASLKTEHAHLPAAEGECTLCHSPHGAEQPRLLTTAQVELCTMCHDDVAEQLKLAHPHAPVKVACGACHNPHGSARAAKLREAPNDLCLGCHLLVTESESAPRTTLYGREMSPDVVPLLSPGRVLRLDRTRRFGHPLVYHPVAGAKDPVDPTKPFTCLSCHVPHGAEGPALQRYAAATPSEFCVKCH